MQSIPPTGASTTAAMTPFIVRKLHCPEPEQVDEALGEEVNRRLMEWIEGIGIFANRLDKVRGSNFGRYAMLCHTDTRDPDRLLLQGQCLAALFAVDDHYCDEHASGAIPERAASRLSLAVAAMEPAYLSSPYSAELEQQLDADPVLRGLLAYMARVARFSTPSQVARVRQVTLSMFVTMAGEAVWRSHGSKPTLAEYLASRQVNSFWPCLVLIDPIGGYEVPANIYWSPEVHRITALVSSATTIVNDLYSAWREYVNESGEFKLTWLLADRHNCSLQEAVNLAADIHDEVVKTYETAEWHLLRQATTGYDRPAAQALSARTAGLAGR